MYYENLDQYDQIEALTGNIVMAVVVVVDVDDDDDFAVIVSVAVGS